MYRYSYYDFTLRYYAYLKQVHIGILIVFSFDKKISLPPMLLFELNCRYQTIDNFIIDFQIELYFLPA